jgi:coenzyme F420-0:L-glutamate ligase
MQAFPISTRVIKPGDNLVEILIQALNEQELSLRDGDVVAFASKIVAIANNRIAKLESVKPSRNAKKMAEKFSLEPEFVELVLQEADKVFGGVYRALLTLKNGFLTVNAGIDGKNAPEGYVVLWPTDPFSWVESVREEIKCRTGKVVGVMIVDSQVAPLRMGTRGVALAVSGFEPVKDLRGMNDVYSRMLKITRHAVADDLACVAHLMMGEKDERNPIVLIRDAPVTLMEKKVSLKDLNISFKECVFMSSLYYGKINC